MAFEVINPLASTWLAKGLSHILFTREQLEELKRPIQSQSPAGKPVPTPRIIQRHAPASPPARQAAAQTQASTSPQVREAASAAAWKPLSMEYWPVIWQERFKQTRRGKIAWTYWNLGPDLLAGKSAADAQAQERAERSRFMQRLVKDLGKPAGTHTFWPVHLDAGAEPVIEPDLFWSGVTALGCRSVIIMGSRAARPLLNQSGLLPLSQVREKGHLVWILRDIDGFPPGEYERMLIFLRQRLASIGI